MSGGRLAQSMSALPSAASAVGRMLHRHQTTTSHLALPPSSSPAPEDENGFVMLQPDKPASTTAVARYDFDGFGGQLSFRRGDEIVLLNHPPLATSSSRQTPYVSSSSTSTSWCVGKRAMDGVTGIVYLPALKLPSSVPSSSSTSAVASPTGPRRGRLFIIDHSSTKAREDEERLQKEHRGYDQYGNAVEDDEPPGTTKRKENYGVQVVGFVLVLLVLLFVLGCLGQAGWGLALLGFLPRLTSLFDRLVQRRFL